VVVGVDVISVVVDEDVNVVGVGGAVDDGFDDDDVVGETTFRSRRCKQERVIVD